VGFTTDHKQLILSPRKGSKSGGFTIALDDELVGVLDDALRGRDGDDGGDGDRLEQHRRLGRQESRLSPREIQARLRSGATLAQVAADAGVDGDWIARFAAPILAEQAQVVGRARDLHYATPRKGMSTQPLGTAVRWNVADRGVRLGDDDFDNSWGAFQLRDGNWVVRFAFTSRQRPQLAEWEVDLHDGAVIARSRLAAILAYVAPRTRAPAAALLASLPPAAAAAAAPSAEAEEPVLTARPTKKRATKKRAATKKKAAVTRKAAKRKPGPGTRAVPKRRVAKKKSAATRKGVAKRAPARRTPARAPARKKAAARKRAAPKKAAAKKKAAPRRATAAKRAAPRKKKAAARKRAGGGARRRAVPPAPPAPPAPALLPPRPITAARPPPAAWPSSAVAVVPPPLPRSLRRARERESTAEPTPSDVPKAPSPPSVAPTRQPIPNRVVTIRADRATPPTQSQLGSTNRRRRRTSQQ
jgi:hypothetical protein